MRVKNVKTMPSQGATPGFVDETTFSQQIIHGEMRIRYFTVESVFLKGDIKKYIGVSSTSGGLLKGA